jgi:hypothetical protein
MIKDSDTVGKSGACGLASRRLAFGGSEGGGLTASMLATATSRVGGFRI